MANTNLTFQELVLECNTMALNKDQNAQIPPTIFSVATRLSTDWLLDEIVRVFPYNQRIVDKARPFLKRKLVNVNDGIAIMPEDYRNILEIRIATNKDQTAGCNCGEIEDECVPINDHCTEVEQASIRKEKCYFVKVNILDQDQYADASSSDLYPPTLKEPIGTFVSKTEFKICPIEGISYIEVVYIKQPLKYEIGYTIMPDDTWQINPTTTIEPEWERNANPDLFRYITTLLTLHIKDGNFLQAFNTLKQIGIS